MKLKKPPKTSSGSSRPDETLPAILLAGQVEIASRWPVLLLVALTWILSLPLFAPWSFWPVGYVVFVPWLLALALSARGTWVHVASYLLAGGFYLVHFRWLALTTVEGYLLCSLLYLAPLFVLAGWGVRHLHRRRGLSLAIVFPLLWTFQELLHSRGPLAFPWFLLGHSQIRFTSIIQIADLAGVYGVSFVVAAVNGLLADVALRSFKRRRKAAGEPRGLRVELGFALGLWGLAFGYGLIRLHSADWAEGPRVAVVQGDFPLSTHADPTAATKEDKRRTFLALASESLADSPDLIVLPETPWDMYLNKPSYGGEDWRLIRQLAHENGVSVVVGAMSYDLQPAGAYPKAHRYNSAFVFEPEGQPGRYDKIHLVLFGEYVPFRYSWYRFYRLLNDGPWNPWGSGGREYSLTPGKDYSVFPLRPRSSPSEEMNFGVTICYEDVIPQVFRRFIMDRDGAKKADFMLNISNDGWFGYGNQQAQHLVACAFRAVENRVSIARSVNTGISGFIRPDGTMYNLVQDEGRRLHPGGQGYETARLMLDGRLTFYSRFGDLLPVAWSLPAAVGLGDAIWAVWKRRREARQGRRRGKKAGR